MSHVCRRLHPERLMRCHGLRPNCLRENIASGQRFRSCKGTRTRKDSAFSKNWTRASLAHKYNHRIQRRPLSSSSTGHDDENDEHDDECEPLLPLCLLPYVGLQSYPDVLELEPGQRVVAIGDVHGDFPQLLNALLVAGVVAEEEGDDDEEGRAFVWTGGDHTILVQIGDILDRGPHELQCWQLLVALSRQAHVAGGKVIKLFGNHELWTSIGFFQLDQERYLENLDYDDDIHDDFEIAFGHHLDESLLELEDHWRDARVLNHLVTNGTVLNPRKVAARWAAMEPGGVLAKEFLAHFKIAVKVGNTVLVHAGMVPEHLDRFGGISGMNDATRKWILKRGPRAGRQHMFVPPNDPEGRLRTYVQSMPDFFMEGDDNAYSPIWMRDYSDPPDQVPNNHQAYEMLGTYEPDRGLLWPSCDVLLQNNVFLIVTAWCFGAFFEIVESVLKRLKADRMVIGHTPQSQVNAILNGKAWRIDVGMSRGMKGTFPEVLEITKGNDGEETVAILTAEGKVPAEERYIVDPDYAHAGT
jgi:Calcineurin-like phosphoesterase